MTDVLISANPPKRQMQQPTKAQLREQIAADAETIIHLRMLRDLPDDRSRWQRFCDWWRS